MSAGERKEVKSSSVHTFSWLAFFTCCAAGALLAVSCWAPASGARAKSQAAANNIPIASLFRISNLSFARPLLAFPYYSATHPAARHRSILVRRLMIGQDFV